MQKIKKTEEVSKTKKLLMRGRIAACQAALDEAMIAGTYTAAEIKEVLESEEFEPILDDLKFRVPESAEAEDEDAEDEAEDEDEESEDEDADEAEADDDEDEDEEEKPKPKASKAKKDDERTYVTFSLNDRRRQRELVYKLVSRKPNEITGRDLTTQVVAKYPEIKPWTVQAIVRGLVAEHHLKRMKVTGSKAYRYAVGKKPL